MNKSRSTNQKSSQRSSGLRLEEARVGELLDAASEAFLSNGFAGASLNEIAKRSKSSKTTFYARFPSKEKLFIAVIERRLNIIFGEVSVALPSDAPLESTLREYCKIFLRVALSTDQMSLLRLVSMEASRFPELGQQFYELGPRRGQLLLANYIQDQITQRRLVPENAATMAEHLVSLLSGGAVRWEVLGLQSRPLSKAKQESHIEGALSVFLRAYRASPDRATS